MTVRVRFAIEAHLELTESCAFQADKRCLWCRLRERKTGQRVKRSRSVVGRRERTSDLGLSAAFPDAKLKPPSNIPPTASLPGLDYESLTLMIMRQAEREKMEREIRQREEA